MWWSRNWALPAYQSTFHQGSDFILCLQEHQDICREDTWSTPSVFIKHYASDVDSLTDSMLSRAILHTLFQWQLHALFLGCKLAHCSPVWNCTENMTVKTWLYLPVTNVHQVFLCAGTHSLLPCCELCWNSLWIQFSSDSLIKQRKIGEQWESALCQEFFKCPWLTCTCAVPMCTWRKTLNISYR